jgi:hypothetical protein
MFNIINNENIDIDIDIVIAWADTNDPKLKNNILKNIRKIPNYSDDNLRFGNRDTLKYVLRSIYKNMPWIRNIFLVTQSQWPNWLDENNAKTLNPPIIRVDHKEIHPDGVDCNGIFAIESCIHNIPGLSDFFLYANDDMYICKHIEKNYWMFNNNISFIFPGVKIDNITKKNGDIWYDGQHIDQIELFNKIYNDNNFPFYILNHQITILNKNSFKIIEDNLSEVLKKTQNAPGRINNDVIICRSLFEYISIKNGKSIMKYIKKDKELYLNYKTDYSKIKIDNNTIFLCTNLNCLLPNDQKVHFYKFMDSYFPDKLKCEI